MTQTEKTCSKCKQTHPAARFRKHRTYCNACAALDMANRRRADILNERLIHAKARAKQHGLEFNLTKADLIAQFERQQGLCYYSNLPMIFTQGQETMLNTISIDKVDATKGYTTDNIVLCRYVCNLMKNVLTREMFRAEILEIYNCTVARSNVGPTQLVTA